MPATEGRRRAVLTLIVPLLLATAALAQDSVPRRATPTFRFTPEAGRTLRTLREASVAAQEERVACLAAAAVVLPLLCSHCCAAAAAVVLPLELEPARPAGRQGHWVWRAARRRLPPAPHLASNTYRSFSGSYVNSAISTASERRPVTELRLGGSLACGRRRQQGAAVGLEPPRRGNRRCWHVWQQPRWRGAALAC